MVEYTYKLDLDEPVEMGSRFKQEPRKGIGVQPKKEEPEAEGWGDMFWGLLKGYFGDEDEANKALGPKQPSTSYDMDGALETLKSVSRISEPVIEGAPEKFSMPKPEPFELEVDTIGNEALDRDGTRLFDVTDTEEGKLTNVKPLEELAEDIDPGTIDTSELPSGKGLMSPSQEGGMFKLAEAEAQEIAIDNIGITAEMWEAYKKEVSAIESGGEKNPYGAKGGYNKHYDGKYQVGKDAKADAASLLGMTVGHSKDDREMFRKNPALQERVFAAYTAKNHEYMLKKSSVYRNLDKEQQLAVLGYAHNQGAGGASKWLRSGEAERDGFDTSADKYYKAIAKGLGITPSLAFTPGRETSPRPMLRPEEKDS